MTFGITPTGFNPKTIEDVKESIAARLRGVWGAQIKTEEPAALGVLLGVFSAALADVWDQAHQVYLSNDPDSADDTALDRISGITGTLRKAATKTQVALTLTGTPATVVPAGRIVTVTGTADRFVTLTDVTIGGGGTVTVAAEAQVAGVIPAYAGTVTTINTAVSGWASVTNAADHTVLGTDIETDSELRVRRELELRAAGNSTLVAIKRALTDLTGVIYALVLENDTDATDANGIPPHSIEVILRRTVAATDAVVAAAIQASKAAGIQTHGDETVTVEDAAGVEHEIKFTDATLISPTLVIALSITEKFAEASATNIAAVKQAISDLSQALPVGYDLVRNQVIKTCFTVEGVIDVTTCTINGSASNLAVDYDEYVNVSTSDITVTTSTVTGDIP